MWVLLIPVAIVIALALALFIAGAVLAICGKNIYLGH